MPPIHHVAPVPWLPPGQIVSQEDDPDDEDPRDYGYGHQREMYPTGDLHPEADIFGPRDFEPPEPARGRKRGKQPFHDPWEAYAPRPSGKGGKKGKKSKFTGFGSLGSKTTPAMMF